MAGYKVRLLSECPECVEVVASWVEEAFGKEWFHFLVPGTAVRPGDADEVTIHPADTLSPEHPTPCVVDGIVYPTVEHFILASRYPSAADGVRRAATAARAVWQCVGHRERDDWKMVRDEVVKEGLASRFRTSSSCLAALLRTGGAKLVYADPDDSYWGSGPGGTGKNIYGTVLAALRETLFSEEVRRHVKQRFASNRFHAPLGFVAFDTDDAPCGSLFLDTGTDSVMGVPQGWRAEGGDVCMAQAFVTPSHRGSGVARALVSACVDTCNRLRLGSLCTALPFAPSSIGPAWKPVGTASEGLTVYRCDVEMSPDHAPTCYNPPPPTLEELMDTAVITVPPDSIYPSDRSPHLKAAEGVIEQMKTMASAPRASTPEHHATKKFLSTAEHLLRELVVQMRGTAIDASQLSHAPIEHILRKVSMSLNLATVTEALYPMDAKLIEEQRRINKGLDSLVAAKMAKRDRKQVPSSMEEKELGFLRRGAAQKYFHNVTAEADSKSIYIHEAEERARHTERQMELQLEKLSVLSKLMEMHGTLSDLKQAEQCGEDEAARVHGMLMESKVWLEADLAALDSSTRRAKSTDHLITRDFDQYSNEAHLTLRAIDEQRKEIADRCAEREAEIDRLRQLIAEDREERLPSLLQRREHIEACMRRQVSLESSRGEVFTSFAAQCRHLEETLRRSLHNINIFDRYTVTLEKAMRAGVMALKAHLDDMHRDVTDAILAVNQEANETFTAFHLAMAEIIIFKQRILNRIDTELDRLDADALHCPHFDPAKQHFDQTKFELQNMRTTIEDEIRGWTDRMAITYETMYEPIQDFLIRSRVPFIPPTEAVREFLMNPPKDPDSPTTATPSHSAPLVPKPPPRSPLITAR